MFRGTTPTNRELVAWIQGVEDRLKKIEGGDTLRGNVSLDRLHRLYDVQVAVVETSPDGHREVTWTSPAGVSQVIATL